MNWQEEIELKQKRHNRLLFSRDSLFLRDLSEMIAKQSHKTLILWSLELAEGTVRKLLETFPHEKRPSEALEAARAWSQGFVKMRFAQRKILDCHAMAKESYNRETVALCHAVGQACSVVHTPKHALGYPVYDLTATYWRADAQHVADLLQDRKNYYIDRLADWEKRAQSEALPWADFIEQNDRRGESIDELQPKSAK